MDPSLLSDLGKFYPEIALTVALLVVVVVDIALPRVKTTAVFLVAVVGLVAAFALTRCHNAESMFLRM